MTVVARPEPGGGITLEAPDPDRLSPTQAREILRAVEPYVESLRRRAAHAGG